MWWGAQAFVRDHGFPYSSQRIQDLSTMLHSSTAVIWFIDVHDRLVQNSYPLEPPPTASSRDQIEGDTALVDAQEQANTLIGPGGTLEGWAKGLEPYFLAQNQSVDRVLAHSMLRLPKISSPPKGPGQNTIGTKIRPDKGLVRALEALLRMDPATAGLGHGLAVTLGLFLTEPTQLLTTIFVVDRLPEAWNDHWTHVGWVSAQEVFQDRVLPKTPGAEWVAFQSETHIRDHVPIYDIPAAGGASHRFDEHKIYLFEKEIYSVDDIPGTEVPSFLDLVLPKLPQALDEQPMIPVYALNASVPRDELIEAFLEEHPLWQWYQDVADLYPALATTEWHLWMRNFILGTYYGADAATQSSTRKTPAPTTAHAGRDIVDSQTPPPAEPPTGPLHPDFDPGPALRALNDEGGLTVIEMLTFTGPTNGKIVRDQIGPEAYQKSVNALAQAGLISIERAGFPGVRHQTLSLVPGGLTPLVAYLKTLYPGSVANQGQPADQLQHLEDPRTRSILETSRHQALSLATLKSTFGDLGTGNDKLVASLVDAGLWFQTRDGRFEIADQHGLALASLLETYAHATTVPLRIRQALEALRNPMSLPFITALSIHGTRDYHDALSLAFGGYGFEMASFKKSIVTPLERAGIIKLSGKSERFSMDFDVSLDTDALLNVVAYLGHLFPNSTPGKLKPSEELVLLDPRNLLLLDLLSVEPQSMSNLEAAFRHWFPQLRSRVETLEEAGWVTWAVDSDVLSINPKPQASIVDHLHALAKNAKTSNLHLGQVFVWAMHNEGVILDILGTVSRHGSLPATRLAHIYGLTGTQRHSVTLGDWVLREGDRKKPADLVYSLRSDNIQKSIDYFRELFPGQSNGSMSPEDVLKVFTNHVPQYIVERLGRGPRTLDQLKAELPGRNLDHTVKEMLNVGIIMGSPTGVLTLNVQGGASLPERLEDILAAESPKHPIRSIPEKALLAIGREGALSILGALHHLGTQWGHGLQQATGLAKKELLQTLTALRNADLIASSNEGRLDNVEAQFWLTPQPLTPVIAYLEETYPREISDLADPSLQAHQFGSLEKIMIIERLRNVASSMNDLKADFPLLESTIAESVEELADAGLIERVKQAPNTFQVSAQSGLVLTERLKLFMRNPPPPGPIEEPPPSQNLSEGTLYRAAEYTKEEMLQYLTEQKVLTAIQIHDKKGFRLYPASTGAVLYDLRTTKTHYKLVRYLTTRRVSLSKSATQALQYVPEGQPTFKVTDRSMHTAIFNQALEVVGHE